MVSSGDSTIPSRTNEVCIWILRGLFNEGHYLRAIADGTLIKELRRRGGPPTSPSEPSGTLSQYVSYKDANGLTVVSVHRYLRPDGTIGAAGRMPDPKRLLVGNRYLVVIPDHGDKGRCPSCECLTWRQRNAAAFPIARALSDEIWQTGRNPDTVP